jgi:hypothetical protein
VITTLAGLAEALGRLDPPAFIFGGVGEDAVLDGAITRPHRDVDVMVARDEVDAWKMRFADLGFTEWEVWQADSRGEPQVLHSHNEADVHLEMSILDGQSGGYYFELEDPTGDAHFHMRPPDDIFSFRRVTVDGVSVQTVSPLALYLIRASLAAAGSFGPYRPQDAPVQERLRTELLSHLADADLAPRLVNVR